MNPNQLAKAQEIIRDNPPLIWYSKSYDQLSIESIVEAVLNYGTWKEFLRLISVIGIKQTSQVFHKINDRPRSNLHKLASNYFNLYFDRYAQ